MDHAAGGVGHEAARGVKGHSRSPSRTTREWPPPPFSCRVRAKCPYSVWISSPLKTMSAGRMSCGRAGSGSRPAMTCASAQALTLVNWEENFSRVRACGHNNACVKT